MVLVDDPRSPDAILAATRRDGFPCWERLIDAWSERRPPAAERVLASLDAASGSALVVAFSSHRAPTEAEHAALARLVSEGTRALVIIVREPAFAADPALCHVDADSWELALADAFDRVCVRQWIWSCAVADDAWADDMVAVVASRAKSGVGRATRPSGDTLWMAGAVFGGVRSRSSRAG